MTNPLYGWFEDTAGQRYIPRTAVPHNPATQTVVGEGTEEKPWRVEPLFDTAADPIVDPDLDIEPDLTPEEEEQVGTESLFDTEQMPAEESVEHQSEPDKESVEDSSDWAEDYPSDGFGEDGLKEPGIDETANTMLATPPVTATLLVVGSAQWELDTTVWQAISNWQARHGVTMLTIATTGCPTGAEAAARRHPHAAAFGHTVIRDEDIGRLGLTAALFFIRDYSQGAERLLDAAKASRLAVTVYREESTEDNSPWRNH